MKRRGISYACEALLWLIVAAAISVFLFCQPAYPQCTGPSCPTQQAPRWRPEWRPAIRSIPRPKRGHEAIVRVAVQDGVGTSYGSGTLIGHRDGKVAHVLTAWHLLRDRAPNGALAVWVAGKKYQAILLGSEPTWDLALFKIADPGVGSVPLSETPLERGETYYLSGYGRGDYRQTSGRLTTFCAPGRGMPNDLMELACASRDGDSGGPILNKRGHLVGVISASDGRCAVGCCFPRIRGFLQAVLPRCVPRRPMAPIPNRPALPPLPTQPSSDCRKQIGELEREILALRSAIYIAEEGATAQAELLWAEIRALKERPTPAPALEPIVAAVLQQINLESLRGPAGPPGRDGRCDVGSLPPITVQVIRDGKVIESEDVYLGGVLPLRLVPVGSTDNESNDSSSK